MMQLSKLEYFPCNSDRTTACMEEMGLSNGLLPDWALTASSGRTRADEAAQYRLGSGGVGGASLPYRPDGIDDPARPYQAANGGGAAGLPSAGSRRYAPAMARLHSESGWRPDHDTMHEYLTVERQP